MADKDSGPEAAVKGIVEDVAGKAKEVVGSVLDRKDLKHEGQDKADAERDVAKKETEAEASRAAASAAETREEAARRA